MIFEENKAAFLKINEDFILVHKSLFEYLYGVYGCDYFIQARQYKRQTEQVQLVNGRLVKSPIPKESPST
jgi:hypothetical protein